MTPRLLPLVALTATLIPTCALAATPVAHDTSVAAALAAAAHRGTGQAQPPEKPAPLPIAQHIFNLTNLERRKAGLPDLIADRCLTNGAQRWTDHMATTNTFKHNELQWIFTTCTFRRAAAENIIRGYPTPQAMVHGWMNSEGHRRNILNPAYTHLGVGYNPNGKFATQNFAR